MSQRLPRLAASVFGILTALAVGSVATAQAQQDPVLSTTCGAGTLEHCSDAPVMTCDWLIDFGFNGDRVFHIRIGRTNCRETGRVPIYKNRTRDSVFSGACAGLNPFLGMPAGAGCSDDDEI